VDGQEVDGNILPLDLAADTVHEVQVVL
jgi:hypothetical protein